MSGLNIIVTAMLFNILVVQGKVFRQEKFLQDKNHVEHYQSLYSDYPRSDDFGNAFKSNFDVWTPDFQQIYQPGRFNYGKMTPDWYPNPLPIGPIGPVGPIGPMDPNRPVVSGGSGRIGYPNWRNPQREDRSRMCRNIKGLPTPDSGCCGVQLTDLPVQQQYPSFLDKPTWSESEDERYRRSVDSDMPPSKMIIGGRATDLHHLPWMVRLAIHPKIRGLHSPQSCGGTIISSRYVLTAAHCVSNTFKDLSQLEVYLGEYNTDTYPRDCITKDGVKKCIKNRVMTVDHVIIHKKYNDKFLHNDIALLRLSSEIPYTPVTRPICLPTADVADLQEENFVIAGWGMNGKKESTLKQAASVSYVPNDKCKDQYSYKDESMFCSIGDHGEDICHGDSGGPLMALVDNKYFLAGVVNGKRNNSECGSSVPSLFNNVFYHMDWIVKHAK